MTLHFYAKKSNYLIFEHCYPIPTNGKVNYLIYNCLIFSNYIHFSSIYPIVSENIHRYFSRRGIVMNVESMVKAF